MFLCSTIVMMSTIIGCWRRLPCLRRLTDHPVHQDGKEIYLHIKDLDPSPANMVVVQAEQREEHPCPHAFVEQVMGILMVKWSNISHNLPSPQPRIAAAKGVKEECQKRQLARVEQEVGRLARLVEEIRGLVGQK